MTSKSGLGATIAYQRWTFDRCNIRTRLRTCFRCGKEVSEGAEIYGIMCDFARYVQSIIDVAYGAPEPNPEASTATMYDCNSLLQSGLKIMETSNTQQRETRRVSSY